MANSRFLGLTGKAQAGDVDGDDIVNGKGTLQSARRREAHKPHGAPRVRGLGQQSKIVRKACQPSEFLALTGPAAPT